MFSSHLIVAPWTRLAHLVQCPRNPMFSLFSPNVPISCIFRPIPYCQVSPFCPYRIISSRPILPMSLLSCWWPLSNFFVSPHFYPMTHFADFTSCATYPIFAPFCPISPIYEIFRSIPFYPFCPFSPFRMSDHAASCSGIPFCSMPHDCIS